MTYLVTGGAGFIGSHVCEALRARGDEVIVLDDLSTGKRENIPAGVWFEQGDICDPVMVKKLLSQVKGVFHLAAVASVEMSRLEWERTHAVNVTGTVNILAASAKLAEPVPVVYASSAAIYGNNQNLPLAETERPAPLTAYGADKLACEQHAKVGEVVHGLKSCGLRFFNVYGPRQDPTSPYSGVISIFAKRIAEGLPITFYGDGQQTRDFVYVGDVVRALVAAMGLLERSDAPQAWVSNVCTGREVSLIDLASTLENITQNSVTKEFAAARMGDIRASLGNPDCLFRLLGVKADTILDVGLRATLGLKK